MLLVTGGAGFIGANFVLSTIAETGEGVVNLDKLTYAGDLRNLCSQLANAGSARNELGRYEEAEVLLRESAQMAERIGSRPGLAAASLNLGMTLALGLVAVLLYERPSHHAESSPAVA